MPLYEYHCVHCGKNFEMQHKMADPPPTQGPECPGDHCQIERQISRVSAVVKSPNPFAQSVSSLQDSGLGQKMGFGSSDSKTKSEPKPHQCGMGCALHN